MSENNNHRGIARRTLAYFFSGVLGGLYVLQAVGKVLWGVDVVVPPELVVIVTAFISFFVGAEVMADRD